MNKNYNTYIILGLQFGDEGKGKIIDRYAVDADYVIKSVGGNNASHTIIKNDEQIDLNMLPISVVNSQAKCILAAGTVIDIDNFFDEVYSIEKTGKLLTNLFIDGRANIVMPYHTKIDNVKEKILGKNVVHSSKNGIGPCYVDKISKIGIRISDLLNPEILRNKITQNLKEKNDVLVKYNENPIDVEYLVEKYTDYAEKLRYRIIDAVSEINKAIDEGEKVIFEGSQALMLDNDFGTYPDVVSTGTNASSICSGAGIPPYKISNIIGVMKAYTTRVSGGLFPSEVFFETREHFARKGNEYVTGTNVFRRCGWLDLVLLKYSIMINGVTDINLTKLDVLTGLDKIKIAVGYEIDKIVYPTYPLECDNNKDIDILYKEFDGWSEDISDIKEYADLPENCKRYIEYIEGYLGVRISLISVGSKKEQIIIK
ncbi:adenylosuccinate synthase [Oceanivirga salmonicida]|uniref:adenylosuccinate synthase n=1 Tax=Oceanivirga salmonicida TaxID=1769291 RepID=UPI0012E1A5B2|nr:adenylosuccinate synthase [Oceanivirga salmonicida]